MHLPGDRDVRCGEIKTHDFIPPHPSDVMAVERARLAAQMVTEVAEQQNVVYLAALVVVVGGYFKNIRNLDIEIHLLFDLSGEAHARVFAKFDLSPGEFPFQRFEGGIRLPLRDKDLVPSADDARGADDRPHPFPLNVRIKPITRLPISSLVLRYSA